MGNQFREIDFSEPNAIAAAVAERGSSPGTKYDAKSLLSPKQFRSVDRALRSIAETFHVDLKDVAIDINEGQGRRSEAAVILARR